MTTTAQTTLDDLENPEQCIEIADRTGKRCQHTVVPGFDYCSQHLNWKEISL